MGWRREGGGEGGGRRGERREERREEGREEGRGGRKEEGGGKRGRGGGMGYCACSMHVLYLYCTCIDVIYYPGPLLEVELESACLSG